MRILILILININSTNSLLMRDGKKIDEAILKVLKESENPVSTREIELKIGKAWHTVDRHCLKLQIEGKVEGIRMSNINFWRIKK